MSVQDQFVAAVEHYDTSFNTSYVSVQANNPLLFYIVLKGFNTSYVSVQENAALSIKDHIEFQYILCVGSRFGNNHNKR